jgi:5'-nucleotidase / UDP-sugar diphosphatase
MKITIFLTPGVLALTMTLLVNARENPAARSTSVDEGVLITLLHTNDLHGSVLYPGEARGLAKITSIARTIRRELPHVFLLDGGDIIHGTPVERRFEGQPVIAAMNAAGYDAAVAGNHEFDFGQRISRAAIAAAKFPLLSANVVEAGSDRSWGGLRPYVVREADGIRIAFFGLTTDRTPEIQWPRTIDGIVFRDPIATARALVPRLRSVERADMVIALTHLGVAADRELANAVPGIDVILGGHSHTRLDRQVWVGKTLIVQTGSAAYALARVDLLVRRSVNGSAVVRINGQDGEWWGRAGVAAPRGLEYPEQPLIALTSVMPDDSAVTAAYRPFASRIEPYLDEQLTTAIEPLPAHGAVRGELALGNLQADAVRAATQTDIGLTALYSLNPAGLRAGPVRVRDLYALFGGYTRQHLVVVRAPGRRIREMLEVANDTTIRLHVAGARVRNGVLYVGAKPLRADVNYTVASAAHIVQQYLLGKEGVTVVSDDAEAPTIRDATIRYLRGHAPLRNTIEPRLPGLVSSPQRPQRTSRLRKSAASPLESGTQGRSSERPSPRFR